MTRPNPHAVVLALTLGITLAGSTARAQTLWDGARHPALPALTSVDPVHPDELPPLDRAWMELSCLAEEPELRSPRGAYQALRRELLLPACAAVLERDRTPVLAEIREVFSQALDADPGCVRALLGLGELYNLDDPRARDLARASEYFERALPRVEGTPMLPVVLETLTNVWTWQGRFGDVRDAYLRLLELPVEFARERRRQYLCNLAETYDDLGDLETALATYDQCIALDPDEATGWWGLAYANDQAGREVDALRAAREALRLDPDMHKARAGRWEDGVVYYVPAYKEHYLVALGFEAQGRSAEALDEWRRYLARGGEHGPWSARAHAHVTRLTAPATATTARTLRIPRPMRSGATP